ncbi:hypothetical protein [Nocardia camponoti]|uniref:DUF4352 domain-containing protein n=1 Tax=Nocardia camponoti TaxID=1616106 RepID=A0A917QRV8_9NOCA|nr:hypothetical protein [Nocardia camponoti]GGK65299.1 hypothetical protein GCM10011591_41940 [Nocardia camponoti]
MKGRLVMVAAVGATFALVQAHAALDVTATQSVSSSVGEIQLVQNGGKLGSKDKPVPLGDTFAVGKAWKVSIVSVNPNATATVLAENQFNDPPKAGNQFVIINTTAQYVGDDTASPWLDLDYKFLGSKGNTYSTYDDSCGVIPEPLDDVSELYPDATATGNVCFSVPTDQIGGGKIVVEDDTTFTSSAKAFFATKK